MRASLLLVVVLGCSSSQTSQAPAPPEPAVAPAPVFAQAPAATDEATVDDAPITDGETDPDPAKGGASRYMSDCSLTHPVARDPCQGAPADKRGLESCAVLNIKAGQACKASSPSCYVERACRDGRRVAADFLICAKQRPGRCLARSSRRYKDSIEYLTGGEIEALARQIEALPLARFRYTDQAGGDPRLGFLTEDAPGAPYVTSDGRRVDLYALLAASIAAIQSQDRRIRALEQQLGQCRPLE